MSRVPLASVLVVWCAGCDPSVGFALDVTVAADTVAALADPTGVVVHLEVSNAPDRGLEFEDLVPIDAAGVDQDVRIEGSAIVGREEFVCPEGPYVVSLVRPDGDSFVPLEPPVEVEAVGDCTEDSPTRWVGTAEL
jgi:hypothetical protein